MAKIRGVKPDYWTDEDIVELSIPARLLFIGLWNYACDNGHLQDKPKQIKMRIFPGDDVNATELLRELESSGRISRGGGWITIPNLTEHQKPDLRYFTTCDKEGCDDPPEKVSQRKARRVHAVHTAGAQGVHDVGTAGALGDGDGEVMVKGSDGDSAAAGKPAKRKRQLPTDWRPNDLHRGYAADNLLSIDAEVDQFRDHHYAKGTTMLDWDAAFRTWLRNAVKWRRDIPTKPAQLPHASQLEDPPPGLSDEEYAEWYTAQRRRQHA